MEGCSGFLSFISSKYRKMYPLWFMNYGTYSMGYLTVYFKMNKNYYDLLIFNYYQKFVKCRENIIFYGNVSY